jgi:hypothetical protein
VNVTGQFQTNTGAVAITLGGRYGTGTAPVNGAAVSGTRFPAAAADLNIRNPGVGLAAPFALTALVSLTAGTSYWFDLALATSNGADQALVQNLSVTLAEVR